MRKLILASGSPRRKEILEREGYVFDIIPSDKESVNKANVSPEKFAMRCALDKTEDVYATHAKGNGAVVLGADTVVAFDSKIYGKPKDETEASTILTLLQRMFFLFCAFECLIQSAE